MTPDPVSNPFAVLSAVAAPAILTNACSVLALGTANRLARAVDRTRAVHDLMRSAKPDSADHSALTRQLPFLQRRGALLLKSLSLFYTALAMFATTALIAIIGSALVAYDFPIAFHVAAAVGFFIGSCGVLSIVTGCTLMIRETRLALRGLAAEHDAVHMKHRQADSQ